MPRAMAFEKHRDRIMEVVNTNTIPAGLQRTAWLQTMIRAFAVRLLPLRAFSTVFSNVKLEGAGTVDIPYWALDATASTDFSGSYSTGNTTVSVRQITPSNRKYQGMSWTSNEQRRQPHLNTVQGMALKAEKLADDVFADILSIVTLANYGAAVKAEPAVAFDSDDVADVRQECNEAHRPKNGRSLVLESAYDGALMKDSAIKSALNFGGTEAIRGGEIPKIMGFDYYECPSVPTNSENLVGFAVYPSAILVGTAPIQPTDDVRQQLSAYEIVTDAKLGVSFEYRRWGTASTDTSAEIVEFNYGYQ